MSDFMDRIFGVHADALQLRARRGEVLASHLANADTPNYKAQDLDFKAALSQAQGNQAVAMTATQPGHMQAQGGTVNAERLYRIPSAPSLDGNTVDTQAEQTKFAENAVRYQVSLRFLNGKISSLMSAIKGD